MVQQAQKLVKTDLTVSEQTEGRWLEFGREPRLKRHGKIRTDQCDVERQYITTYRCA